MASWSIDGQEIAVDPSVWIGTRDRSWGIRPIGEPEPAGRPDDPPFEGMWWLYVPMAFDDFGIVLIIQEDPHGFRSLNDCTRIWKDGRVEQLGWPRVKIHYRSGTRIPTGATIEATAFDGSPVHFDVESKLPVPIHVGGGYGGDSDWLHGVWKGDNFTERLTYDMTDPAIVGRAGFGVIDHVGRAVCRDARRQSARGLGLVRARRARPSRPVGLRRLADRRALKGWWVGGVADAVEAAFPLHPVGALGGSGAFSGGHGQAAVGTWRRTIRKNERPGGDRELGEEQRATGGGGVGASAGRGPDEGAVGELVVDPAARPGVEGLEQVMAANRRSTFYIPGDTTKAGDTAFLVQSQYRAV